MLILLLLLLLLLLLQALPTYQVEKNRHYDYFFFTMQILMMSAICAGYEWRIASYWIIIC